jgi:hypothetical protein
MLERPVRAGQLLASADNLFQFALRCRHKAQSHRNPNNRISVSPEQYRSYFKFTVVRNPWARAFSWYKNCMRDPQHRRRYNLTDNTSFTEFLSRQIGRGSLRPQTSWLTDYSGRIAMDYIARFESLQSGLDEVCKALGIGALDLPHELKGSGEDYREQFDDQCIRMIKDAYKAEIDLFGYTFDA